HVLWELDRALTENYPGEPPRPSGRQPFTRDDAVAYVSGAGFWKELRVKAGRDWTGPSLTAKVRERVRTYEDDVPSSAWVRTFSGKEVVRELRGTFRELTRGSGDSAATFDV